MSGSQPGSRIKTSGSYVRVQVTRQATWEQALELVALNPQHQLHQGRHLLTLLRAGHHLTSVGAVDDLLHAILHDAVQALDAQRGAIVLADPQTGELRLRAVVAANSAASKGRPYSQTLADRCFLQGESLLCGDVSLDASLVSATSVQHGAMASVVCALLRSPRLRLGVLHLDRGPFQEPFSAEEFTLADAVAASVSVGIESAQLAEQQREQFIQTLAALARTVEVRDPYTAHHTERVTAYALMLADRMGLSPAEQNHIKIGTPLHDIGKIGIDDAILRKPGKLTPQEYELMKEHTLKGAAILESIPALGPVIPIVRHHHERWDGSGYPDGLSMERISRLARVVAVADAFDAMTSNRPYRPAMPLEQAFAELVARAGSHFDPECVEAFLSLRSHIEKRFS